ncbi:site-specific integrase [Vibrio algivorus]|uniref:Site-specific integrase n=1 Tax=Vibrio algivorus TaxID=1667024 RepID=A0A557PEH9_9VIBR|nr:site-specific integrase [Vibrio algivorus]TVO39052.1 site-specific integrase [Vibrio algivorus]
MQSTLYRKANYLILSNTGIYTFRWNLRIDGKHYQPKLSLKTRNYLEAIRAASKLALTLHSLSNPSLSEVKALYADYRGDEDKQAQTLTAIDIATFLTDLSPKSKVEYTSCWKSFVDSIEDKTTSIMSVRAIHIDNWKTLQKCSPITLKKKLKLLSSCFNRAEVKHDNEWFKLVVKDKPVRPRRALTDAELNTILLATEQYKPTGGTYLAGGWKYYLPRIAALTGCRLNEMAQLQVSDIVLTEQPHISINDNGERKRVKNQSSIRQIPLTKELRDMLMPLMARKSPSERLFNDLPYNQSNGYNGTPSKWFGLLIRNLLKDESISFHSLRHYAVTKLFNAGIKEELIGSLVGHSVGKLTTGKVYLSGFTYDKKLGAIAYLNLPRSSKGV